jgi:hypothetical protein
MRLIRLRSAFVLSVLMVAGCQSQGTDFPAADLETAEREVEAQLGAFWDAWMASSFEEGMAYYSGSPDLSFITDGYVWESKGSAEEAYRPFFAGIERQEMDLSETRVAALTPEVVLVTQAGMFTQYLRSGEVSPERDFALSMTWVKMGGEWKVMAYHFSMANPSPATLRSVHLFNMPSNATEAELVDALETLNAGVREAGFRNAGYGLWKREASQSLDATPVGFEYLWEGLWPDQAGYDEIHESEAYLAAGEGIGDVFDRIAVGQLYSRFVRVSVGGPGEG